MTLLGNIAAARGRMAAVFWVALACAAGLAWWLGWISPVAAVALSAFASGVAVAEWWRAGRPSAPETSPAPATGGGARLTRGVPDPIVRVAGGLPWPLIAVAADQRIIWRNPAAARLLSLRAGQFLETFSRHPDFLTAVAAGRRGETPEPVEIIAAAPVERTFLASVCPLPEAGRRLADAARTLIAFQDMTHARRAARARTDFVANASHELRTPLTSLIGFLDLMDGDAADADSHATFLATMRGEAGRMLALVDDLMSLSRIEMEEHTPPEGTVDLARLAAGVVGDLEPSARARGMAIEVEIAGGTGVARGDARQLAQAARNLVENAIRHGAPDTPTDASIADASIKVSVTRENDATLALCVRDSGPGVAQEHLPRLTERFYRAGDRKAEGTGLGLAIVKHVVNRHGGRLRIQSAPGRGSAFTITLPAA